MSVYRTERGETDGVLLVTPDRFVDARGWTGEVFNETAFAELGLSERFIQDNHNFSARAGTIRGLHHQSGPAAQAKLVRCVRGAVFNVGVDLRRSSPTFGRFDARELTPETGTWIYLPAGYTQGFATLQDETEVHFKVSVGFSFPHRAGLRWDDPALAIPWPQAVRAAPILSDADRALPMLADLLATNAVFD